MTLHQLPFGTSLTDSLLQVIRAGDDTCYRETPHLRMSLMWVKAKKGNEPWTMKWGLFAVERKHMQRDDIFRVDGITLHIDETARMRSVGKVLDWQKGVGVIEIVTPSA